MTTHLKALCALVCLTLALGFARSAAGDLVGHWTFDEGKGETARDVTGNGHEAAIHGARHEPFGNGFALRLDGEDDYVDCGKSEALGSEKACTVMLWFRPEAVQGGLFSRSAGSGWPDERFVVSFKDYQNENHLTYALADGKQHVYADMAPPPMNKWSHAALSLRGRYVRFYLNGMQIRPRSLPFAPRFAEFPLHVGRSRGLGTACFKGLIDDVRVYDRALSQNEIVAMVKADARARGMGTDELAKPVLTTTPAPLSGRLIVGIDYQLMWPLPEGARFEVEVFRSRKARRRIHEAAVTPLGSQTGTEAILDLQMVKPGKLHVRVQGRRTDGAVLGKTAAAEIDWPERAPMFHHSKGIRALNSFVFELLNVENPRRKKFTFHNPRQGWIYVAVPTGRTAGAGPTIIIDSAEFPLTLLGDNFETMRYLAEGTHSVKLGRGHRASRLIVRAIPELVYSMYGSNPLVRETGIYTWEWLGTHVLDHYNSIIGRQNVDTQDKEIREWTARGKRWFTQRSLPWDKDVDKVFAFWTREPRMSHPLLHGIWADEFLSGERYREMYPLWCEAMQRIKADPRYRDRKLYAYLGMTYAPVYDTLATTLMECDFRLAAMWYLREQPTEGQAWSYISPAFQRKNRAALDAAAPGAGLNRMVVLGLLSQPEESCDLLPHVNYNAFLDIQFQLMANDPAFVGTRGVQGYYSPYCGEEQTRLLARLLRHYAIEGRRERMLDDPYELPHLVNPDFAEKTNGWRLAPADPDSIAAKTAERFGNIQGRYDNTGIGDTALWTRRSAAKPNVVSQMIKRLQPGRLYSFRFFTGNYRHFIEGKSHDYKHPIAVEIEGVQQVPEKCFQAQIKMGYWHKHNGFNRNHRYYLNYHQIVFRANAPTARLALSDWPAPDRPGGPEAEEFLWNFMQVQPYFE